MAGTWGNGRYAISSSYGAIDATLTGERRQLDQVIECLIWRSFIMNTLTKLNYDII